MHAAEWLREYEKQRGEKQMAQIEVRHLTKTFTSRDARVDALKDINLEIEQGDIYGIIGMSGAGKSTLVRCLNYLEQPTEGEVLVEGRELGKMSEKELLKQRKDMAMIFQHFNLLMQKNVVDNVSFPLLIQGIKKKDARKRAKELLGIVGLEEKASAYPAQLSELRARLPHTFFLVPGYGAQGGPAQDLKACFNEDGLGAVVNSSRGIIAAYKQEKYAAFGAEHFGEASRQAVADMVADINRVL